MIIKGLKIKLRKIIQIISRNLQLPIREATNPSHRGINKGLIKQIKNNFKDKLTNKTNR